jgi:hypothetical protein
MWNGLQGGGGVQHLKHRRQVGLHASTVLLSREPTLCVVNLSWRVSACAAWQAAEARTLPP